MLRALNIAPYVFELDEVAVPEPKPGEVLLKILQAGICGSDILICHGKHKYAKLPVVMGHEAVALVERCGEGVEGLTAGDLVTIQPQYFCGSCYACRHGNTNVCENLHFMGVHVDGFFTEYFCAPAWNVVKLPAGFTRAMGQLVEPLAVAVNAIRKGDVREGTRVVVIGAGPIGNLTAQVAKAAGAVVMVADLMQNKVDIAKAVGIQYCINSKNRNLGEEILRCFGDKADVIYDCAAVPAVFNQAIETAANSSKVVIVGSYKDRVELDVTQIQRREIDLRSVMQYTRGDFLNAVEFLGTKKIVVDGLISQEFPLKKVKEAFLYIDEHRDTVMKVAIKMCEE